MSFDLKASPHQIFSTMSDMISSDYRWGWLNLRQIFCNWIQAHDLFAIYPIPFKLANRFCWLVQVNIGFDGAINGYGPEMSRSQITIHALVRFCMHSAYIIVRFYEVKKTLFSGGRLVNHFGVIISLLLHLFSDNSEIMSWIGTLFSC